MSSRGHARAARAAAPLAPGSAGGHRAGEGERMLLAAVLEDAIACFRKHGGATRPAARRLHDDAEAWLFGGDGDPFSVEYVCQALAIDVDWLRARLLAGTAPPAGRPRPRPPGQMSAMLLKNSLSSL